MPLDFPRTPDGKLGELWRATIRLVDQLTSGGLVVVNRNVAIGTAETSVAHGLKSAPQSATLVPKADCRWWQTREPDAKYVYFAASTAVTANVVVFP